jgi:hypothetical protein
VFFFVFWRIFLNLATEKKKKKGLANPTKGIFLRHFEKKNSPYLDPKKKNLEVARFRQCVPVGRQI